MGNFRDLICWQLLEKVGRFLFLKMGLLLWLGKPALSGGAAETLLKKWRIEVIRLIEDGMLRFLYVAIDLLGLSLGCTLCWHRGLLSIGLDGMVGKDAGTVHCYL